MKPLHSIRRCHKINPEIFFRFYRLFLIKKVILILIVGVLGVETFFEFLLDFC